MLSPGERCAAALRHGEHLGDLELAGAPGLGGHGDAWRIQRRRRRRSVSGAFRVEEEEEEEDLGA